jgi:Reverse transcriptase (RNA-dependent DNA polymerase)
LNNLRSLQQCHTSQLVDTDTPSLKVALKSHNSDLWEAAIHEELESLREAETCKEVEALKGAKLFPSKFVLKVKRHSDEANECHKTRLVLLVNLQRPDIDFYDTYAPVANFSVVRIMFVIAYGQKWLIHQLDVKCAILNGRIDEDIYMRMPDGYGPASGLFCKLKRSIYGLRQAPRAWNKRLTQSIRFAG